jgi:hypothetical protein
MDNGSFFDKRAASESGHFFRDLPGRDSGEFSKSAIVGGMPQPIPPAPNNLAPIGASMGGQGQGGAGMGGGATGGGFGTGKGLKKKADEEKDAAPSPTTEDLVLPTGFHRPTKMQPEALEDGGERFHNTDAAVADFGVGKGLTHSLVEGGRMRQTGGSQIGKHAAVEPPRFLGTPYAKVAVEMKDVESTAESAKQWGGARAGEFKKSVGEGAGKAVDLAGEGVKKITQSPLASIIAAGLIGKMGLGALGRGARGLKGLVRRPPPAPAGGGGLVGAAKRLILG